MAKKEQDIEKKGKQTPKKEKEKKPNFFVRIGIKLKETFSELKRVTWPTIGKALKSTGIVLAIVAIFLVLVTLINFGLGEGLKALTQLGA